MLQRIIFWGTGAALVIAPLPLAGNRIWAVALLALLVFGLFILHLLSAVKASQRLLPPRYAMPVMVPVLVVWLWLGVQMVPGLGALAGRHLGAVSVSMLSFDPSMTHMMWLKTAMLLAFVWMVFSVVNSKQRLYQFALIMVASGFIQALYGTWLNLNPGMASPIFGVPYSNRATGAFMYHNQLANFLALTLSIGIGVLVSQLSMAASSARWTHKLRDVADTLLSPKMVIRLGLIIMVIALILTRSRMGNSAFFMSLAGISAYALFFYNRPPRNMKLLIISFFILDLLLIGSFFGVEKVKQRLVETSLQSETRDEVVRDAIPMIMDYPVFGMGGGSFYSSFPAYHPEKYSGFYDHAHNDYIQFAVELGLPMTLLLGWMMLYSLWTSLKTMAKRKTPLYQGIAFGSAIAVVHMLLHATVDFSLQSPAIALMFMAILSLSHIAHHLPSPRKTR